MKTLRTLHFPAIIVVGAVVSGASLLLAHRHVDAVADRAVAFESLRGEIALLDETLTMSARLYAATADERWLRRYEEAVAPLDMAIASALAATDDEAARLALARTGAANQALIEIETRAIDMTRQGRSADALPNLLSLRYRMLKDEYADGLADALGHVEASIARARLIGDAVFYAVAAVAVASAAAVVAVVVRRARLDLRRDAREGALRHAEERLRLILAVAPIAVALFDAERRCVAASERFVALFGFGADPPDAPLPEEARERRAPLVEAAGAGPLTEESALPGGAARWIWRESRAWRDARGQAGVVVGAADVSDLRSLGAALDAEHREAAAARAERDRFVEAVDHARQEIYLFDAHSLRFTHVNRGARKNLGYPEDQLAAMTPLDIEPSMSPEAFDGLLAPLRTGETEMVRFETDHRRSDGTTYPVEITLSLRGDGADRRFLAIADDIAERREREREQRLFMERLELSESDLRVALEEAAAASALKSEFLARMTHEIRTPLNGILGGVALARVAATDAARKRWLDTIEHSARALHQVIDDVLDIAQIEAGAAPLAIEPFDPVAMVGDLVATYRERAEAKGLALDFEPAPTAAFAFPGDLRRVRRVVESLIDNAVKFTDSGRVDVRLDGDRRRLRIEVQDTGPGIPAADQEAIFERFRQVDGSTTRAHGGVGLGLALAKEFAGLMQGRIGVRSWPGEGSTFWLEIDAQAPLAAAVVAPAKAVAAN